MLPLSVRRDEMGRMHYTAMDPNGKMFAMHHLNNAISPIVRTSPLVHWGIMSYDLIEWKTSWREPTYKEKLTLIQLFGQWKQCAVEIMPISSELVDRVDAYHLYEFPCPIMLEFQHYPIFQKPTNYTIIQIGDETFEYYLFGVESEVQYLYLRKQHNKVPFWRQKQKLKDKIVGAHRCAVEMIIPEMETAEYTALIVLPTGRTMGFPLSGKK